MSPMALLGNPTMSAFAPLLEDRRTARQSLVSPSQIPSGIDTQLEPICLTIALPRGDLTSPAGQPFVRRNGALEVVIFLAGKEAEIFQRTQQTLGFGGLAKNQIGLSKMFVCAAVTGIQHECFLI